ncbi:TauD/TfdA family dioxygenase [Jannaschia sp.]|nr:TauD/TfdA family dioxygenase [Jannaschia sp.]
MSARVLDAFYPGYRAYMALIRRARVRADLTLGAGEMIDFDNRRELHERAAFDPATRWRHLRGCYVDRGEFDAPLRTLGQCVRAGSACRDWGGGSAPALRAPPPYLRDIERVAHDA